MVLLSMLLTQTRHLKKICPASSHETCQLLKISPEWVTGPEQGKSSGRIATVSLWTGVFRDGISSIPDETVTPLWLGRQNWIQHVNRMPRNR